MKYRKKPVVIEATQWFKNGDHPLDVSYYNRGCMLDETLCKHCGKRMYDHGWIETLEGGHVVCPGDWIITGVKGEHYPCKPEIFEMTYEKEENMITEKTTRPLTFGEKAVGITFNPSQDLKVERIKRRCADLIDEIHKLRTYQANLEVARMASIAITDIQSAQMWAVKAVTWKHEE